MLQVISVSVLARRIPAATYRLVGMAMLVMNLLETIRDVGTGTALVREQAMPDELASTGFWLIIRGTRTSPLTMLKQR